MRNMSFAETTGQVRNKIKTVTRRQGWLFLKPGDLVQPVEKAMGLKRGQHVKKIGGPIRVVSVRREQVMDITLDDVEREGFPAWDRWKFIDFLCNLHKCVPTARVTRIEFEYVE